MTCPFKRCEGSGWQADGVQYGIDILPTVKPCKCQGWKMPASPPAHPCRVLLAIGRWRTVGNWTNFRFTDSSGRTVRPEYWKPVEPTPQEYEQ